MLTDKEREIVDAEYEKHKRDNMCPHTTNPLQLKRLCKRCKLLDQKNISIYQMPQGDWGCSVGDPDYSGAIVGLGVMSDGFKTRNDAEEWALNKGTKWVLEIIERGGRVCLKGNKEGGQPSNG